MAKMQITPMPFGDLLEGCRKSPEQSNCGSAYTSYMSLDVFQGSSCSLTKERGGLGGLREGLYAGVGMHGRRGDLKMPLCPS